MALHTIRLRDPWERCVDSRGHLLFSRWFNAPTGIGNGDRVYLVVESFGVSALVLLNEQNLGRMTAISAPFRGEISDVLHPRNQICIALEVAGDSLQACGLAPIVRLEIEDRASES
jgi:hypothetical protein